MKIYWDSDFSTKIKFWEEVANGDGHLGTQTLLT